MGSQTGRHRNQLAFRRLRSGFAQWAWKDDSEAIQDLHC